MLKVRDIIQENEWSQREAARILGVGQPRIAEIMSFNTKDFSVDMLLKYLSKLGPQGTLVREIPQPESTSDKEISEAIETER